MQASDAQQKIDTLAACGPLRAWSVIVTILGDLCQDPNDRVSGRSLTRIMGTMGISAQTVRVALHRLRRDGWIQSIKVGRDAVYFLSATGWEETQSVKGRIYAPDLPANQSAQIALGPPSMTAAEFADLLPKDTVLLAPRTALLDEPFNAPKEIWTSPILPGALPAWMAESLADETLRAEYGRLTVAVAKLLANTPAEDPVVSAALRLLTLHHWRRLRLRHGDLPDLLLGPDWEGAAARRAVMAALNTYTRPDPGALEDIAATPGSVAKAR